LKRGKGEKTKEGIDIRLTRPWLFWASTSCNSIHIYIHDWDLLLEEYKTYIHINGFKLNPNGDF
jgi:hypothetical protein